MRLVMTLYALANAVLGVGLVSGASRPLALRAVGIAAIGVVAACWADQYRRGRDRFAHDIALLSALVVLGAAVLDPARTTGIAATALVVRAMFPPTRRLYVACIGIWLVYGAMLLPGPPGNGRSGQTMMFIALPFIAAIVLFFSESVRQHEESLERERVLKEAARHLVGATDLATVYSVAAETLQRLEPDQPCTVAVSTGDERAQTVVACLGLLADAAQGLTVPSTIVSAEQLAGFLAGESMSWQLDVDEAGLDLGEDVPPQSVVAQPIIVNGRLIGSLTVASPDPLAGSHIEGLENLAAIVGLAVERMSLGHSLASSEARFRALVQNSSDVIAEIGAGGRLAYVSPSLERVVGWRPDEVVDRLAVRFVHRDDRRVLTEAMVSSIPIAVECRLRHRDGTWRDCEVASSAEAVGQNSRVLNIRDISDRKSVERQLEHTAFHDTLTGLPNRAMFTRRVDAALANYRHGGDIGVLFIDVDNFKQVNDSLGHITGDKLLVELAARMTRNVRETDVACRLGGDEFAVLVEGAHVADHAIDVASRLADEMNGCIEIDGRPITTSVSIGVVVNPPVGVAAETVLSNADIAMYAAKTSGRGRYQLFEEHMHKEAVRRLRLIEDVRQAVERDELHLEYQPIVDLATLEPSAVEALARWTHPELGPIPPSEFIPLAEEVGAIAAIGHWALATACREASEWTTPDGRPITVTVNTSIHQLQTMTIVDQVRETLRRTGRAPATLCLEVTESSEASDIGQVRAVIRALRELGVQIAIDDFGIGNASFDYLREIPADILKIDRVFLAGRHGGADATDLMSAIVHTGAMLGLTTVAEGIETAEQLDQMRATGCLLGQGYLFARPGPAGDVAAVLQTVAAARPGLELSPS